MCCRFSIDDLFLAAGEMVVACEILWRQFYVGVVFWAKNDGDRVHGVCNGVEHAAVTDVDI